MKSVRSIRSDLCVFSFCSLAIQSQFIAKCDRYHVPIKLQNIQSFEAKHNGPIGSANVSSIFRFDMVRMFLCLMRAIGATIKTFIEWAFETRVSVSFFRF